MTRRPTNDRWRRYLRFFGPNVDADVDDELQFHLDMRARDYERRGLPPSDARYAAYERFGNFDAVNESLRAHDYAVARTERRRDLMDDLRQDLLYALRSLRRAPGFAAVAIITLALGIGANTAVFSVVDAVLLRALPYPRPEQLTSLSGTTLGEYVRVRELNRSWQDVAAFRPASINLSGDGEPERLDGGLVSPNVFSLLGMPPALGRGFTGDETSPDRMFVVILSDRLWKRRFGGDPAIVGKSILVEGAPYKVLGVMPPEFGFPTRDAQLWIPINMPPSRSGALWGNGGFRFVGRLRNGVTPAQAQQELRALYAQIRHENPVWDPGPTYGTTSTVTALQQQMVGSARTMLFLLLGVVGVVLLIACANVANLLLVRAAARGKEVAVRTALGGGRGRLMRQFITESVVLTSLGGACGVAVAWVGIHELMAALPSDIPRIAKVGIDARVLGFTSAIVIATGFVFGLLPALRATPDVQSTLRDGQRTSSGKSHRRLSALLVAGEIAAAVLLVIAASLLIRSAVALQRVDPGLRVSSVVTARLTPPRARYTDPKSLVPLYDQVLARLEAMPGVQSAGAAAYLPLGSGISTSIALRIEGQFEDVRHDLPMIDHYQIVTPLFLSTMSIPIITGRAFTNTDRTGAPEVAVISESFAKHYWPNGDAVGKRIGYPWPSDWITIVGVVKDVRSDSLSSTQNETFYRPLSQAPTLNMSIFIRTTSDPGAVAASIRRAVAGVDPGVPVSDVQSMHAVVERSAARQRFTTLLLTLFAGLALLLGMVGIYGVMSYAVAQRTREIGVRMALGASPSDARRMVLKEGLSLAGAGIVVGLMAAAASTRALSGLLYGVTTTDPLTFVVVPAGVVVIVLLASYLPARRATRVDPTTALRAD